MKSQIIKFSLGLLVLVTFAAAFGVDRVKDSGKIRDIESESEIETKLNQAENKLVVIYFFATWCKSCKKIDPVVKALAEDMLDVVFLKVDVDKLNKLADKYEIIGFPTFMLIRKNKNIDKVLGNNAEKLRELIKKHRYA